MSGWTEWLKNNRQYLADYDDSDSQKESDDQDREDLIAAQHPQHQEMPGAGYTQQCWED
jgi:hypothetical protein